MKPLLVSSTNAIITFRHLPSRETRIPSRETRIVCPVIAWNSVGTFGT